MMPTELTKEVQQCHICGYVKWCTYVKAAHVPLYAWVCDMCFKDWVRDL